MVKRGLDNALPWAKIGQASYRRSNFDSTIIESIADAHRQRTKEDRKFQHLIASEKRILEAQGKNIISLVNPFEKTVQTE